MLLPVRLKLDPFMLYSTTSTMACKTGLKFLIYCINRTPVQPPPPTSCRADLWWIEFRRKKWRPDPDAIAQKKTASW